MINHFPLVPLPRPRPPSNYIPPPTKTLKHSNTHRQKKPQRHGKRHSLIIIPPYCLVWLSPRPVLFCSVLYLFSTRKGARGFIVVPSPSLSPLSRNIYTPGKNSHATLTSFHLPPLLLSPKSPRLHAYPTYNTVLICTAHTSPTLSPAPNLAITLSRANSKS